MTQPAALTVHDLTVRYHGGLLAVQEVSLEIARGEMVALVGESGCGKSSLVKALLGLLPSTARVDGSAGLTDAAGECAELVGRTEGNWGRIRGRCIAVIPQGAMAGLSPVHRIDAQLVEMIKLHTGKPSRQAALRAAELTDMVSLDRSVLQAYPHELSGGMRQRVAIALALSGDPAVVIADEPTTGLDAVVQQHVLSLLSDLRSRLGVGMLLVSHDLPGLARHADRLAVMYAGRLAELRPARYAATTAVHPYTLGLLAASASVNPGHPWGCVPGSAPAVHLGTAGCRFAPRCPLAVDICRDTEPTLLPVAGGLVACHRAGEGAKPTYPTVPRAAPVHGVQRRVVRVSDVRQTFHTGRRSVDALRGIALEVSAGEILGLVGESGSGKSTLARIVLGVIRPTSGRVELGGLELTGLRGRALRRMQRRIGFIHQDPYSSLHPAMTVGALVAEPLAISGTPRAGRRDSVSEALTAAGLPPDINLLDRYPHQLSGGQRQRVALARALVSAPVLLVADEATSMLDVSTRAGIAITLRSLATNRGLAVLFITHDLGEAVQSCDRIIVLKDGEVVETGSPAVLVREPFHPYTRELLGTDSTWRLT